MAYFNPFSIYAFGDLFESLLPDFALAFTFFTALIYAVLERRLGGQRPAVAVSAALGLALSAGLVWWEYQAGRSIRDLGPLAAGFALILLAGVLYQAIRHVGGNWSGAALAFGACILIGWLMGFHWFVDSQILQTAVTVAMTVGVIAFLLHRKGFHQQPRHTEMADARHDMTDLRQDDYVADRLTRGFQDLKKEASSLYERPERVDDVMLQLKRMLPAEGWLTQRMARLREKIHHVREGHVARIEEMRQGIDKLPGPQRRKLARELKSRYRELKFDVRLERLDKAVAQAEFRIRQLTAQAQAYLEANEYQKLVRVLEEATKLQKHNTRLIRLIEATEKRLMAAATDVARKTSGVTGA